ncbi:GTPase Era [Natranaerofaba carboxydovora]|uniref:GTPase Era n=1 Tax=Natranaerofaba carboxydovora TaxID=2742683 RepID=UPI001F13393A|nr:GTPase Era [Natranaerofaba carboxydovora]UMZ73090.1 GTPase Era [Natranaerofaba carboxydovora]
MFRSGFVSLLGRPNVGKSTLVNMLIGEKIVITSDKPQTTRNKIHCILNRENAQLIFIDTPGMHKPKHRLGENMVRVAQRTQREVDAVLLLMDGSTYFGPGDKYILEVLNNIETPVVLVINKTDLVDMDKAKELGEQVSKEYNFDQIFYVSALEGENLDGLIDYLVTLMPEGPKYYPDDMITDQPERLLIAELVREKLLHHTSEEVPHSIAVEVDKMSKREGKELIDINATIYVERKSQKGIVIGKSGKLLKKVGELARKDIEHLLGSPVFLQLWVKEKRDWKNKAGFLQNMGYD